MAFGKRSPAGLVAAQAVPSPWRLTDLSTAAWGACRAGLASGFRSRGSAGTRRRIVATACFGLVLGFGGVTAGTTFVQASERSGIFNFFQDFFGAPASPPAQPRKVHRAKSRYVALPDARRIASIRQRAYTPRPAIALDLGAKARPRRERRGTARDQARSGGEPRHAPTALSRAQQSICVRTCDGYMFPLGRLRADRDVSVHKAACAAACPNAATVLYKLPAGKTELEQAVSLEGSPYLASAWANVYRQKRVANCSCNPPGIAVMPLPIARDETLRVGDVVATGDSAEIVTGLANGSVSLTDYRNARIPGRGLRRDVERRVGAIRREQDEARFRKALRVVEARAARIQFAELKIARMRLGEARSKDDAAARPAEAKAGFAPVRVLVPSPYDQ